MERTTHTFSTSSIGPTSRYGLIRQRAALQTRLSELRAKAWLPRFRPPTIHLNEGILMKPTRVAILSSLLLWTATALTAQRVQTSYDHTADFSSYKTYCWSPKTASTSLWDQRVEEAVSSSLAAKGLTQVPSGGELAIFASDMSQERQKLVTFCNGTRGGWGGGGFGGGPFCDATTTTRTYTVDKLIVNIFDANSRALLWHASSTDTLSGDSNTNIKNLNRDVQRLFSC